jgi:hypothetical protein
MDNFISQNKIIELDDIQEEDVNVPHSQATASTTNDDESSIKKRKRSHPIWEFFEVTETNVICKISRCSTTFKLPPSTSVCKKHLQSIKDKPHRDTLAKYEELYAIYNEENDKKIIRPKCDLNPNQPDIRSALLPKYKENSDRYNIKKI